MLYFEIELLTSIYRIASTTTSQALQSEMCKVDKVDKVSVLWGILGSIMNKVIVCE